MTAPDPLPDPPGFTEAMAHALAAALETEQVVALWRERDRLRDEEMPQLRAAVVTSRRAMWEAKQHLQADYPECVRARLFLDAGIAAADQALRTAGLPETTEARP